jgi:hypothetical protein
MPGDVVPVANLPLNVAHSGGQRTRPNKQTVRLEHIRNGCSLENPSAVKSLKAERYDMPTHLPVGKAAVAEEEPGMCNLPTVVIAAQRKPGRPGLIGGRRRQCGHGGNLNPSRNRKGGAGNPPPKAGAPELHPNRSHGGTVTQLAIERAGLENHHLKRGAPECYPINSHRRAAPGSPHRCPDLRIPPVRL